MSTSIEPWFDLMLDKGASDLHLSPGYPPMLRLRGDLVPGTTTPLTSEQIQSATFAILSDTQRTHFTTTHDLDFAYQYGPRARFRGNLLRKLTGVGAVFRTIPTKILSMDQLGCPAGVRRLAGLTNGLVLVTGPTGSGKSTTLAAMIDSINATTKRHILTIEDPVEFVHTPKQCMITHKEVGMHVESFLEAIRSSGRENADVILVGELRGPETMRLALQLASFGILIFATVHTNSAPATIDRFVNVFPAHEQPQIRGMLADALAGVVAQQLLKKADGSGRIAVQEILIGSGALAAIIREGKTAQITSFIQAGAAEGMQSMDATLAKLVQAGQVKAQDAWDKALDKESFAKYPHIAAALGDAVH